MPLRHVQIFGEPTELPGRPGVLASGWVSVDTRRVRDVDALALLEFAFAGQAAELALLRDRLPGGHQEDFDNWRRWTGMGAPSRLADVAALLGESVQSVLDRMSQWAQDRAYTIDRLSGSLLRTGSLDMDTAASIASA